MSNNGFDIKQDLLVHQSDEFAKLRELVMQHKVCWEVWPEPYINQDGKKVLTGFELYLIGTHYHPDQPPQPGCSECVKVFNDLKQIAGWIIPKEERDSRYQIGLFDASIRFSPRRKSRKDITLTIKILHREGFDQPVDACEIECIKEMEKKLKELGAQKEHWQESIGIG